MAVMALYILLGTFLDEVSTILITVPVTLPLIISIGYDGIWFGIFVTVMCTIGLISPPTGMTVFVIQAQHPGDSGDAHLPRHAAVPGGGFRAGRAADLRAVARAMAAARPLLVARSGLHLNAPVSAIIKTGIHNSTARHSTDFAPAPKNPVF